MHLYYFIYCFYKVCISVLLFTNYIAILCIFALILRVVGHEFFVALLYNFNTCCVTQRGTMKVNYTLLIIF